MFWIIAIKEKATNHSRAVIQTCIMFDYFWYIVISITSKTSISFQASYSVNTTTKMLVQIFILCMSWLISLKNIKIGQYHKCKCLLFVTKKGRTVKLHYKACLKLMYRIINWKLVEVHLTTCSRNFIIGYDGKISTQLYKWISREWRWYLTGNF